MGHSVGTPCIHENPAHEGKCSSVVVSPFVDHDATRYFEVTETGGHLSYWRTNSTARAGIQVEHRRADGRFHTSMVFDTERAFLRSIAGWEWREITAEEVPKSGVSADARAEIDDLARQERTADADTWYQEDHQ